MKQNAAIYYIPDGYDTHHRHLMGRRAAGEAFLKAYANYSGVDEMYCYIGQAQYYKDFCTRVGQLCDSPPELKAIANTEPETMNQLGCLYYPAPGIADIAWQRRHFPEVSYSICGITHTTASKGVIQGVSQLFTAPVEPWDAIICTSHSVQTMLKNLIEQWQDYLQHRLGKKVSMPVKLPVIPLGVDYQQLAEFKEQEVYRQAIRDKLGIGSNDTVFLFFGRLSFHAKANPLPMFRALGLAAKKTKQPLHLIMAGWFANDTIQQTFIMAAQHACPDVKIHFVDGRKPDVREKIWYAADIFTSLSDNIQETFGLTPLEAMAAGLPVVVSDWNGYRDSVRDGEDGFLIPTYAPIPGVNEDIAYLYETDSINYDFYIGSMSLSVAIDHEAVAQAYIKLIEDKSLRLKLGQQAQAQVKKKFDWKVIIKQYQVLWQKLEKCREKESIIPDYKGTNPLALDPMEYFQHYPTYLIDMDTKVARKSKVITKDLQALLKMPVISYTDRLFKDGDCIEVFENLSTKNQVLSTIIDKLPNIAVNHIIRIVAWLAKAGVVTLSCES